MKKSRFSALAFIVMLALLPQLARGAWADVTAKDVHTIARVIGFLEKRPDDGAVIAVIYNPGSEPSTRTARQMEEFIRAGKMGLRARAVPVSSLAEARGAAFALVAEDLSSHYNAIGAILLDSKILSFTFDRACLAQGACAVYINSQNNVEIAVNKSVLEALEARFKSVFLMMVTMI